jgi:hypothetical protein
MPVYLTKGTKETIPVDITDRTGVVTTLDSATGKQFDVLDDADVAKYSNQAATNNGMRLLCLVDTSAAHPGGEWAEGHYRLFPEFTLGSEVVRLGPLDIYIIDTN